MIKIESSVNQNSCLHLQKIFWKKFIKIKKYEHITNQRKDFLHKLSINIVNKYDTVCIEDLDMKTMSQYLNFATSVHDNG